MSEVCRQRRWLWMSVPVLGLAACASLLGPRTVEISQKELTEKLDKRFPVSQRMLNVLEVQATRPSLTLLADTNRVRAAIPVQARDRLMGQYYQGQIQVSFGLRYVATDRSIRLTQVQVDQVQIAGVPEAYQRGLTRIGALLAEDSLQDYTIHQFKPEDLQTAQRLGYEVKDIQVTSTGLAIHLQPSP